MVDTPPNFILVDSGNGQEKVQISHAVVTVKGEYQDSQDLVIEDIPIEYEPEASSSSVVAAGKDKAKRKKYSIEPSSTITINDALINLIVADELPLNVSELEGFRKYSAAIAPAIELPSQLGLRLQLDQRYMEESSLIRTSLDGATAYALSISEWVDSVHARNFMGITCHFVEPCQLELKSAMIGFEELAENLLEFDLTQRVESILSDWFLQKGQVTAATVQGTSNTITSTFHAILGQDKVLYCFAQSLNGIARKPFEMLPEMHALVDEVKVLTEFLRQGDELAMEDSKAGQEVWELIYSVNTTWKAHYEQLARFLKHAKKVEALLYDQEDAPPMPSQAVLMEIRDVVRVYRPLKSVCDDLCSADYLSASKVIPLVQCLLASLAETWPETPAGVATKEMIVDQISEHYAGMEENEVYAVATLLDPRFKKSYFKNAAAKESATEKLKQMVSAGSEPPALPSPTEGDGDGDAEGIWRFHSTFVADQPKATLNPLTMFLSTKTADLKNTDPLKYFMYAHVDFRPTAERLFVSQATSVPAKRVFSETGCTLNSHWTSLPSTELRKLMLLSSVTD